MHGTDKCLAHSDAKTRESVGFVADNGLQGRPKQPRVVDVMRERVEAEIDAILEPYFRALKGAMLYGTAQGRGEIVMSEFPDLGARIKAAELLLDRVYGRPRQQTEVTGADGGPLTVLAGQPDWAKLSDDELRQLRGLLERAGRTEP